MYSKMRGGDKEIMIRINLRRVPYPFKRLKGGARLKRVKIVLF